ncbi:hypothetical protein BDF21DRAFT_409897 [Thamnidium elegans]|nr:hypothetical protein BDF21DRAFT_409897 [Thamnidium elegans]
MSEFLRELILLIILANCSSLKLFGLLLYIRCAENRFSNCSATLFDEFISPVTTYSVPVTSTSLSTSALLFSL